MNTQVKKGGKAVLVVLCIATFAATYAQYQLPSIAGYLMEAFGLSATQFSSLFSAPLISTVLLSMVAGLLVDRLGAKPVVMVGAFITAGGILLRTWAGSYPILMVSMLMAGLLTTILTGNGSKIFAEYYPPEKVGSVLGIYCSIGTLAMFVGTATTAMLPSIKITFAIAAILICVSVVAMLLFWRTPKTAEEMQNAPVQGSIADCLKASLKSKNIWVIGLVLGMNMAAVMVLNTFLPTALATRGLDAVTAGYYSSIVMVGNFVSAIVIPVIAMKTGKTKLITSLSTVIGGLGVAFAWKLPTGVPMIVALFVTGIAMSGIIPLLSSIPFRLPEIGSAYAGTAGGVVVTINMLCAVIIPTYILTPLVGNNMPLFFGIGGGLLAIGLVLSLFVPDVDKL